jgi:hypothetical protein
MYSSLFIAVYVCAVDSRLLGASSDQSASSSVAHPTTDTCSSSSSSTLLNYRTAHEECITCLMSLKELHQPTKKAKPQVWDLNIEMCLKACCAFTCISPNVTAGNRLKFKTKAKALEVQSKST